MDDSVLKAMDDVVDADWSPTASTLELIEHGESDLLAGVPDAPPPESASPKKKGDYVRDLLRSKERELANLMPGGDARRHIASAAKACLDNPDLLMTAPITLLSAVMDAARLGLDCSGKQAQGYLIPRWNSELKRLEAHFQVGYKGLITLYYRSGVVGAIDAEVVYDGEDFEYSAGTSPGIVHRPKSRIAKGDDKILAAYAVCWLKEAPVPVSMVMWRNEIDQCRATGQKGDKESPAWRKWYSAMAMKCPLIRLQRVVPTTDALTLATHLEHQFAEDAKPARPRISESLREAGGVGAERTQRLLDRAKAKREEQTDGAAQDESAE